jgi:hypothetical protein
VPAPPPGAPPVVPVLPWKIYGGFNSVAQELLSKINVFIPGVYYGSGVSKDLKKIGINPGDQFIVSDVIATSNKNTYAPVNIQANSTGKKSIKIVVRDIEIVGITIGDVKDGGANKITYSFTFNIYWNAGRGGRRKTRRRL